MNLYEVLGVQPGDSTETIKAAYRAKAKLHHPDKGGSKDAFAELQQAYAILTNAAKRKRYDATGDVKEPIDVIHHQAVTQLSIFFEQQLQREQNGDMVENIRNIINRGLAEHESMLSQHRSNITQWQGKLNRIKSAAEVNLYQGVISKKVQSHEKAIEELTQSKAVAQRMLKMLDDYTDEEPNNFYGYTSNTTATGSF